VMRVRLVRVGEIFERMPFVVRDLARETGRTVDLQISGQETEIDKYLVERMMDPVLHLVRNAVSHGIEPPADRAAHGKPEAGKVVARLTRAEGEWVLVVRDDGAGLSAPRIRERLLELGWYTPEQLDTLPDRQVVSYIFKPGFSTADALSLHAGRGVGLDVVQANVQKLGARITLASTPGAYTEFRIRFPA